MPERYLRLMQMFCKQVSEIGFICAGVTLALILCHGFLTHTVFGLDVDPSVARIVIRASFWCACIGFTSFLIRKLAIEPVITARLIKQLYK